MNLLIDLLTQLRDKLIQLKELKMNPDTIYVAAKNYLGQHLTLNPNVPPELGCAECASYILKQAGFPIPTDGEAGTLALHTWCLANGFYIVQTPEPGDLVFAVSGTSIKGVAHGHVAIVGLYGLMSNDSNSGIFRENYTIDSWNELFVKTLGFPLVILRAP